MTYHRSSVQVNPENAEVHFNMAVIFHLQGKLHDALAHFKLAVRSEQLSFRSV